MGLNSSQFSILSFSNYEVVCWESEKTKTLLRGRPSVIWGWTQRKLRKKIKDPSLAKKAIPGKKIKVPRLLSGSIARF